MFLLSELVIWAIICLLFVSYERGLGAFVATLIATGVAAFAGFNVFALIWANPVIAATAVVTYAGIGLIWASVKWYSKLKTASKLYDKTKSDFLASNEGYIAQDFVEKIRGAKWEIEKYAPTLSRNKGNLGFWLMWWPFSMISFLFSDLIQKLWNLAWAALKGFFEAMRKKTLGQAAIDLD